MCLGPIGPNKNSYKGYSEKQTKATRIYDRLKKINLGNSGLTLKKLLLQVVDNKRLNLFKFSLIIVTVWVSMLFFCSVITK